MIDPAGTDPVDDETPPSFGSVWTAPYLAFNGHVMTAPMNTATPPQASYWAAQCMPTCGACGDGEELPDW